MTILYLYFQSFTSNAETPCYKHKYQLDVGNLLLSN